MSLRINSWRSGLKWLIWLILAVLLLVFVIKVSVYEHNYLNEKDGSERAIARTEEKPEEELVEVEPTKEEVREYTVAPDRPRYLTIEKLNIEKARVLPMGVDKNGQLATPNNIFDVGWYIDSGKPGQGKTMVIDGHNGGPHVHGVFKKLPSLVEGDLIKIERGDGIVYTYSVVENRSVDLADANAYMSVAMRSPEQGRESISLISCTGEWSQLQDTYLSRQFTRAVLVQN